MYASRNQHKGDELYGPLSPLAYFSTCTPNRLAIRLRAGTNVSPKVASQPATAGSFLLLHELRRVTIRNKRQLRPKRNEFFYCSYRWCSLSPPPLLFLSHDLVMTRKCSFTEADNGRTSQSGQLNTWRPVHPSMEIVDMWVRWQLAH